MCVCVYIDSYSYHLPTYLPTYLSFSYYSNPGDSESQTRTIMITASYTHTHTHPRSSQLYTVQLLVWDWEGKIQKGKEKGEGVHTYLEILKPGLQLCILYSSVLVHESKSRYLSVCLSVYRFVCLLTYSRVCVYIYTHIYIHRISENNTYLQHKPQNILTNPMILIPLTG